MVQNTGNYVSTHASTVLRCIDSLSLKDVEPVSDDDFYWHRNLSQFSCLGLNAKTALYVGCLHV